jgi:hypothetical protein
MAETILVYLPGTSRLFSFTIVGSVILASLTRSDLAVAQPLINPITPTTPSDILISQKPCPSATADDVYRLKKTAGLVEGILIFGHDKVSIVIKRDDQFFERVNFFERGSRNWESLMGKRVVVAQMICTPQSPNPQQ